MAASAAEKRSRLLDAEGLRALSEAVRTLELAFATLPEFERATSGAEEISATLMATAQRLQNTYPYHHPLYAGQMLKPPHPIALLTYTLAMSINPNNHALEGGRATSPMEKEAVAQIAAMFGWETLLGHLCGGGTMANLEALWVAGQLAPGKTILASAQAHYTHERISKVLQLPFETVTCDERGRMDVHALETRLSAAACRRWWRRWERPRRERLIRCMKFCGCGRLRNFEFTRMLRTADIFRWWTISKRARARRSGPSARRIPLLWIHTSTGCSHMAAAAFCSKIRVPGVLYKHNSPYTYFLSTDLHLGEISLECSRPGAVAAALWATQRLLPLVKGGEFARNLAKGREAALELSKRLRNDERFIVPFVPELDVLIFALKAESVSAASALSRRVFDAAGKRDLHLALLELPVSLWPQVGKTMERDRDTMICLRSALMKPEHLEWVDEIWGRFRGS